MKWASKLTGATANNIAPISAGMYVFKYFIESLEYVRILSLTEFRERIVGFQLKKISMTAAFSCLNRTRRKKAWYTYKS